MPQRISNEVMYNTCLQRIINLCEYVTEIYIITQNVVK